MYKSKIKKLNSKASPVSVDNTLVPENKKKLAEDEKSRIRGMFDEPDNTNRSTGTHIQVPRIVVLLSENASGNEELYEKFYDEFDGEKFSSMSNLKYAVHAFKAKHNLADNDIIIYNKLSDFIDAIKDYAVAGEDYISPVYIIEPIENYIHKTATDDSDF